MKFLVKCLVSSVNSSELPEAEAIVKEVEISNPKATLQNLRAAAAVQFRINAYGFRLVPSGRAAAADLSDETKPLSACGLSDGCEIILVSKHARPSADAASGGSGGMASIADEEEDSPQLKAPRTDVAADEDEDDEDVGAAEDFDSEEGDEDSLPDGEDEEEVFLPMFDGPAGELYGRLIEVVPNLVEMREQFLQNPEAVMQRIQREDPTLFQLIAAQQEAFVELINDEARVRTLQNERDIGHALADGEMDEEAEEAINQMIMQYMSGGGGADGGDEAGGDGHLVEDEDGEVQALGEAEEKKHILAFVPSEEDEKKIQDLVQLGFPYDQCKLAFYKCKRSLDRAASLLFDQPPQL